MAEGLLGIATSGLFASQRHIRTTGHNIANVNTEGYSRQRTVLSAREPQFTGGSYVGRGVNVATVERTYDDFLSAQVRSSKSAYSELESYRTLAAQVDNFIAEPNTSLTPTLQAFFNSVNEVADDPTSTPARQVMFSSAENLADRFATMDDRFNRLRNQVNSGVKDIVTEINELAESVANLNGEIIIASGKAAGQPPNDLMDQRDRLIDQLSEKIDVSSIEQKDGTVTVFVGSGQSLVLGTEAATMQTQNSVLNPGQLDIRFTTSSSSVIITQNLTGGELTGNLKFKEEVLDPAQKALGRVAVGLAVDFNAVHSQGYDLKGNAGGAFFSSPSVDIHGASGNAGSIGADYDDVNRLQVSDYRLDFDGTNHVVTRLSDNAEVYNNTANTFIVDGISVDASGAVAGDRFLIRPTQGAGGNIDVALSDPSDIAAALSNTAPGQDSVGDNRNALALAALENNQNLSDGTATFQDAFGKAVAEVGALTHSAQVNTEAQEGLLNHALEEKDSVSGVNLDEEAANLIRYQQAYQASAQLVSVVNTIFDALLSASRR